MSNEFWAGRGSFFELRVAGRGFRGKSYWLKTDRRFCYSTLDLRRSMFVSLPYALGSLRYAYLVFDVHLSAL